MNKKESNEVSRNKRKRLKKEKKILIEYHPKVISFLERNNIKYVIWEVDTITE